MKTQRQSTLNYISIIQNDSSTLKLSLTNPSKLILWSLRRFDTCTVQNKVNIQKDNLYDSLRRCDASCPKGGVNGTKIITTTPALKHKIRKWDWRSRNH